MIALFINTNPTPYRVLGYQHYEGLSNIEGVLVANMDTEWLVNQISQFIQPLYYPAGSTAFLDVELSSTGSIAIETYMNGLIDGYNEEQQYIISTMLNGILAQPVDAIGTFLLSCRELIDKSSLTLQEKIPLYFTVEIAITDYAYWTSAVNTPTSTWYTAGYFNADKFVNWNNIPHIVHACVYGTLACANKAKTYGLIDPPPVIGTDAVSALFASITLAAGKAMLGWIQQPRLYSQAMR